MSNLEELPDGVVVFRFFNKSTSGRARTERTGDKCVEQSKSSFLYWSKGENIFTLIFVTP